MRNLELDLLTLMAAALITAWSGVTLAENADRSKPINLEADTVTVDDLARVSTYQGHVRLSQGTLLILADTLIVTEDKDGFSHGSARGNPASFRQKREGVDEYVEGYGQRIEYDSRSDKLELFTQARMKRNQDEVRGNFISYDGKTELFKVLGGGKEAAPPGRETGRVRAVIQPKVKKDTPPESLTPIPLKGAANIAQPQQE
ncbi:MAG: lipopolysaccharide transport periplasmic protein LptA [Sulfuricellaceae bacterium]|nr:lipopolysaccharide transport periplasmic protein LptA [Sulfuricellaceae bacterium]